MRILTILPKWVLPVCDGSRVASSILIQGLSENGVKVDVLAFAGDDENVDFETARKLLGVRNIFVIRRETVSFNKFKFLFNFIRSPLFPITFTRYIDKRVVKQVIRFFSEDKFCNESSVVDDCLKWDVISFEGIHSASFAFHARKFVRPYTKSVFLYRAQNCEADLWRLRAKEEKNPLFKVFLYYQYLLVRFLESSLVKNVDGVVVLSEEDARALQTNRYVVVPVGKVFKSQLSFTNDNDETLLFVGRLDWQPNKDGLKWFLKNVWPEAVKIRSNLKLKIVGSGNGDWLENFKNVANVEFCGMVQDLVPYYQEAVATIVPIFYGSGTRVKAIEAASYGRACLGTELGVAMGLGLEANKNYIRLEDKESWLDYLITFNKDALLDIGEKAFFALKEKFDYINAARMFIKFVEKL